MNILSQTRILTKICQKLLINLRVCVESGSDLHFIAIWQKYEYFKSDKNFKNCQNMQKNGLSMQVTQFGFQCTFELKCLRS